MCSWSLFGLGQKVDTTTIELWTEFSIFCIFFILVFLSPENARFFRFTLNLFRRIVVVATRHWRKVSFSFAETSRLSLITFEWIWATWKWNRKELRQCTSEETFDKFCKSKHRKEQENLKILYFIVIFFFCSWNMREAASPTSTS